MIERCGHLLMLERLGTFHRLLYDFLVGVEAIPDVLRI
jgi:hypothetical protein